MNSKKLKAEADRLTEMLKGKMVRICKRHRSGEILVEFECGTKLFIDAEGELEVSITGCEE